MIHFARRTSAGVELRSRFWMGGDIELQPPLGWLSFLPNLSPLKRLLMWVHGVSGYNMATHCVVEYTRLGDILPSLHARFAPTT